MLTFATTSVKIRRLKFFYLDSILLSSNYLHSRNTFFQLFADGWAIFAIIRADVI